MNRIPKYLIKFSKIISKATEEDGAYEIIFQLIEMKNEVFKIFKTKDEVSQDYLDYLAQMDKLKEKYKSYIADSGCYATRNNNGRILFGYSDYGEKMIPLEDITDLVEKFKNCPDSPIIIRAISQKSNNEIEIFNDTKNGYDAMISKKQSIKPTTFIKKSKCRRCGCETYKVYIKIHNTGKADLLAEQCEEITEKNWTNAFDWISIDLECSNCGNITKDWFEMETM